MREVKQLIKYQCEICKKVYDTLKEAIKCESRGKELPLVELGKTILYKDDWNGGFGTCFDKIEVVEINDRGHYLYYQLGDWKTKRSQEYVTGNDEFKELCIIVEDQSLLVNKGSLNGGWEYIIDI